MMKRRQFNSNLILGGIVFALMLSLLCISCSKDQDLGVDDQIIGKWDWIETINAWTGIKYTPESEGYSQTSIYKNDNTVESYKNGDLVNIESYLINEKVYDPQDPNSGTAKFLVINESKMYYSISNDTLTISQAHVDGPASIYKRIE